ncbi:MAG: hypothetical protein PQJ46_01730, partial [Spirochaetales bacterium]|nr:hypothetical protein [Spirochaetales bacterium]
MPINQDNNTADFLILQYSEIDFLINRKQFTGSSSLTQINKITSSIPYFDSYTNYNSKNLILCNVDKFLMDKYKCTNPSILKLCLIFNISELNKELPESLKNIIFEKKAHEDIIGLFVSSLVEIKPLFLGDFNIN